MTRARQTLAIALSALALTACGGGGGDNKCTDPTAPGCSGGGGTTNQAPTAEANGPYASVVNAAINLSAAGSADVEDQPQSLTYEWNFGDGKTGTGAQVSHTYTTVGNFTATLKVTDTKGKSATDQAPVTITAAPTPGTGAGTQTGTLGIVLTDAPFPFDSVQSANIFVVRVDAQFAEPTFDAAAASPAKPTNADPNAGWVVVAEPNRSVNLLTLQGGRTLTLGQAGVTAGTYRGFRLILDASQSNIELKGGAKPAIQWGATGGLVAVKITPAAPVALASGAAVNVLVDFDLGRSFDLVGATPGAGFVYQRDYSLRTIAASQTGTDVGRISVDNALAPGVTVELLAAGTGVSDMTRSKIVASTMTDVDGVYRFTNVQPGEYVRRFTFPARYRVDAVAAPVTIAAGAASTTRAYEFESLK